MATSGSIATPIPATPQVVTLPDPILQDTGSPDPGNLHTDALLERIAVAVESIAVNMKQLLAVQSEEPGSVDQDFDDSVGVPGATEQTVSEIQ